MTRLSFVCVFLLSFIGFNPDLFAAKHGGGGRPSGGARMSAPRASAPRASAPRMSTSRSTPHTSAPRPSTGSVGARPSSGGHAGSTRVGSTGTHSSVRSSGGHAGSTRVGSTGGHTMARSGGAGNPLGNLNTSKMTPTQRTNLMSTNPSAADLRSLKDYYGTTPRQPHPTQQHQHVQRQPVQHYQQPRTYEYQRRGYSYGGGYGGGSVGINISPMFGGGGSYCETDGCYDTGCSHQRRIVTNGCDDCLPQPVACAHETLRLRTDGRYECATCGWMAGTTAPPAVHQYMRE